MEDILLPSKIEIVPTGRDNESMLVMEPFFHGYGHTVGNALRRVLLSSLQGAAVIAVKIKGASHEFQAVPNVKEDVLEIILNLKQLRLKVFSDEPVKLTLHAKGDKKVTGKDIQANSDVEVANPNLHIATITDKSGELEMEITVAKGRGYVPTEERGKEKAELGTIAVDALYSPIRSVGYKVDDVRVGQVTNYDRLTLTIETDGTVDADEAVRSSAKILIDHFALLTGVNAGEAPAKAEVAEEETEETEEETEEASADGEEKPKKKKASKKK
ncbi:MAG: DNA-directed RNA polymerase subunit alpha [Patescibacteria group bacterium]|nr:MAG: DNA-directed RNA polymerase subunit alpha [Patescibacteria group bacterium]